MAYGLLEASDTYAAKINAYAAKINPPPPAPFPGLYLPPQPSISRLNCIFHMAIAPRILSGELATCSNSYIACGKGWYFVWKSGKYLLFYAKHDVSSPFQSTQLLSLAQIKGVFLCWAGWKCAASACWCNFVIFRFTLVSTYYHCHWKALFRECQ